MIDLIKELIPDIDINYNLFDEPYAIIGNKMIAIESDSVKIITNYNTDIEITKSYSYDKFKKDYVKLIT